MAFGLDIGSHSIKAVQLTKNGNGYSLFAAGITSSVSPGMESENEKDLASVAEAIKKLLNDAKIQERRVNVSLPEAKVFTRLISLPTLTDEEVASAISWQAEPYIPIPVNEAAIDYQIVGRRENQGPGTPGGVDVLLVAAPKALVQKYIRVGNLAGLTVSSVETELLALSRAVAPKTSTALILDLGATSSDIAIVRNGQLLVSRSIATAGNSLTRSVSAGLGLQGQQAEEYKKTYGLDSKQAEGRVRQALEPAFRIVIDEMKKAMQFYAGELKAQDPVRSAILTGGTAGMPEIVSYVTEKLGLETTMGNPFAGLGGTERISKQFSAYAPLYGVAAGLAMNI